MIDLAPRRESFQMEALRQENRLLRDRLNKLVTACDAYAGTLPTVQGADLTNRLAWSFEVEQARPKIGGR